MLRRSRPRSAGYRCSSSWPFDDETRTRSNLALWQTRLVTDLKMSDSISVAVTPDELYALVSDVTRMGDWSPICRACWWDEGDGPRVGAWFTGRNELPERTWETRCQVVAADPGREFAWEVNNGWVRWGYTFEPEDGGTRLTESWEFLPARHRRVPRAVGRKGRRADRESARSGQERYPRHAGGDQEDRRILTCRETVFQHACSRPFAAGIPFRRLRFSA